MVIFMLFRLKEIRNELELTQRQIASILGVTRSTYSLWEIEKNIIPLTMLNKLSNTFNISIDYITKLSDNKNKSTYIKTLNKKEIGRKIRFIRKKNNLSQEKLAKVFNTTHSVISAYENGHVLIPTIFLVELTKLTNTSIEWLCNDNKNEKIGL